MSVSGTYCPPNCPKYPLFRTMYASTKLQLLELFRGLIVMHDRCADQDGVGPGLEHGVHLPSRLNPAHGDGGSILPPLPEDAWCRPQVNCQARTAAIGDPQDIGRCLDRRIPRAPHARRCELDFRNHSRGPSRRGQSAQEGWTPERFASHVVVAFPEKGLRVHHEALKGVHRPPPSTNFLRWPSRRYARFRTPSPSRGPPPQGGVLPGGNPPSRKRRYRPPRWPGASLASARVRLAESARPPWPRSPAPPPPSPSSPRDRSRSPPALAGIAASGRRPPLRRSSGSKGKSRPSPLGRGPQGRAQSRGGRPPLTRAALDPG